MDQYGVEMRLEVYNNERLYQSTEKCKLFRYAVKFMIHAENGIGKMDAAKTIYELG